MTNNESRLMVVKIVHTLVWAIFATAILLIPISTYLEEIRCAWGLIGFVLLEVIVLIANQVPRASWCRKETKLLTH